MIHSYWYKPNKIFFRPRTDVEADGVYGIELGVNSVLGIYDRTVIEGHVLE